ncbi:MAG: MraY family glycosyltransferase [Candidatus Shapirobacteria bacterium]|jgi:UDP-GlcNAc:undecaprenyl-phosphate GlcNAc-1-phosphate transferase
MNQDFFLSLLIATAISYLVTPLVIRFFVSRHWVEDPLRKQLKTHNATALKPVPRGGGIAVFLSVFITSILFLPLDRHLVAILLAAFFTLLIGIIDDLYDLSPYLRLFTNLVAALIVVGFGIGIAYITNPFGGVVDLSHPRLDFNFFGPHSIWLLADLLAVLWIIWCTNIVGWAAGVEGQLPGFVSIAAIFIGILGLKYSADISQWPVIVLSGAVAGGFLGFLPFNFYPQKIMPGYSGKSLAGFFLAIISILSGAKLATLIFLLGLPMIDAVWVIIRRLGQGKSIFHADGQHLHHQLLKAGWSRPRIAVFYWLISLILGVVSLFLNSQQKFYALGGLAILFFGFTLKFSRRI